ncbi:hypothetical protein VP01_252g1 [Puccinia sorghi]|uniref:Uncharacterized protein n=1 Tax=Puccinia sorghi TaxID=27349 RepID=A0A0L6V5H6_9BASI|nr:hypothetical protein VP01_252g1 [Puccinia sorghi]
MFCFSLQKASILSNHGHVNSSFCLRELYISCSLIPEPFFFCSPLPDNIYTLVCIQALAHLRPGEVKITQLDDVNVPPNSDPLLQRFGRNLLEIGWLGIGFCFNLCWFLLFVVEGRRKRRWKTWRDRFFLNLADLGPILTNTHFTNFHHLSLNEISTYSSTTTHLTPQQQLISLLNPYPDSYSALSITLENPFYSCPLSLQKYPQAINLELRNAFVRKCLYVALIETFLLPRNYSLSTPFLRQLMAFVGGFRGRGYKFVWPMFEGGLLGVAVDLLLCYTLDTEWQSAHIASLFGVRLCLLGSKIFVFKALLEVFRGMLIINSFLNLNYGMILNKVRLVVTRIFHLKRSDTLCVLVLSCAELIFFEIKLKIFFNLFSTYMLCSVLTVVLRVVSLPSAGRGVSPLSFNKTQRQKLNTVALAELKTGLWESGSVSGLSSKEEEIGLACRGYLVGLPRSSVCVCLWVFERSTCHQITQTNVFFFRFPTGVIS